MWQRPSANARQTGSNEAPLNGGGRRWGGGGGGGAAGGAAAGGADDQQQQSSPGGAGGNSYQQGGNVGGGYEERGRSSNRPDYDRPNMPQGQPGYQQQQGHSTASSNDHHQQQNNDRRGPPSQHQQQSGQTYGTASYGMDPAKQQQESVGENGERKRKSRWGGEQQTAVGGMPTALTGGVEGKDLESYAVQLRLDEIQRALRSGLIVPPDGARSPSPPPTYDSHGRRTNTREVRYKRKLEDERMRLVDRQIKLDPNFKPPTEYLMAKRQNTGRPTDKVYIPVKDYPEINFFGLLVGPRGNSLKGMERDSGAKISIRGKGSVKEGKGRPGGGFDDDENDELHCLITGDTEEKVQRCVKLINSVIEIAASVPEGQNDHKRSQLRELASLNGTLRDDENQVCQNCGGAGHRKYDCPEQKNWSAGIICRVCGGAGHMARDCTQKRGGPFGQGPPGGMMPGPGGAPVDQGRAQQFDSEYASLMAELGETSSSAPVAGGPGGEPGAAPWNGDNMGPPVELDENGEKIPPWRIPSNWNPPQPIQNFNRGPPMHHNNNYNNNNNFNNNNQRQQYGGGMGGMGGGGMGGGGMGGGGGGYGQGQNNNRGGYSSFPTANSNAGQFGGYQQQPPPPSLQQGGGYGQ